VKRSSRLSRSVVDAIDKSRIFGIRAGTASDHRFVGVWPIVVEGRVFARSWTLKRGGWYRTFLVDPIGAIQIGGREVPIRARVARGQRLWEAIEQAYAEKYPNPGSSKYVRGFRTARRRAATIEFLPR
jgi:hypothetical protein